MAGSRVRELCLQMQPQVYSSEARMCLYRMQLLDHQAAEKAVSANIPHNDNSGEYKNVIRSVLTRGKILLQVASETLLGLPGYSAFSNDWGISTACFDSETKLTCGFDDQETSPAAFSSG